ncbi:MAG: hypothetical protein HY892_21685 [Deltaproteobacteria bacterium]|nr:hypothetical protein [Deltaproteobacteria bacterium]
MEEGRGEKRKKEKRREQLQGEIEEGRWKKKTRTIIGNAAHIPEWDNKSIFENRKSAIENERGLR